MYCMYYQAILEKAKVWFVTGALRNESNWAFDRTLDLKTSLHEFFVAPDYEKDFLNFMSYFEKQGYVKNLQKMPNRLEKDKGQE